MVSFSAMMVARETVRKSYVNVAASSLRVLPHFTFVPSKAGYIVSVALDESAYLE